MSSNKLNSKAVLVTGGGSGIGRAVCQLFAKEGASVAVFDINQNGCEETLTMLDKTFNNTHCIIPGDVTKVHDVTKAFEMAEKNLGIKCTIMVNCAGISRTGYVDDMKEEEFDKVVDVNLKGTYLMSKEFIKSVKDSEEAVRGVIVNISSCASKGARSCSVYASSKAGVVSFTTSIALEFPKHRVRCNAISPGFIDTPMLRTLDASILSDERIATMVPLQRLGKPEEVAEVCLFLASEQSSFVNGACVPVTGGFGAGL